MDAMNRYVECFGGNRMLASAGVPGSGDPLQPARWIVPARAARAGAVGRSDDPAPLAVGRRQSIGEPDAEPPTP